MDITKKYFELSTTSRFLRLVAGIVISSGIGVCLLQGAHITSTLGIPWYFLGGMILLLVTALGCGFFLQDNKTARVALGILLCMVPAFYAILGARILTESKSINSISIFYILQYPHSFLLLIIGSLISGTSTLLAFQTLARNDAIKLTAVYLLFSFILLFPNRHSDFVTAATLIMIALQLWSSLPALARESCFEERACYRLLSLPIVINMVRATFFHHSTLLLLGLCLFYTGIFFIRELPLLINKKSFTPPCEWLGITFLLAGAFGITVGLGDLGFHSGRLSYLIASILVYFGSRFSIQNSRRGEQVALIVLSLGALINCFQYLDLKFDDSGALELCAVSLAVICFSIYKKFRLHLIFGVLGLALSLSLEIAVAVHTIHLSSWVILIIIGVLLLIVASILEYCADRAFLIAKKVMAEVRSW